MLQKRIIPSSLIKGINITIKITNGITVRDFLNINKKGILEETRRTDKITPYKRKDRYAVGPVKTTDKINAKNTIIFILGSIL